MLIVVLMVYIPKWHFATWHDFVKVEIYLILSQDVEPAAFSAAVSHFLNCLLSSSSSLPDSCSDELLSRRRSRRRRSHGSRVALVKDSVWTKLTASDLWSRIRTEAEGYYHYTIDRYVFCCVFLGRYVQQDFNNDHPLCVQWKYRRSNRKAQPSEDLPTERDRHQDRHPGQTSTRFPSYYMMLWNPGNPTYIRYAWFT